MGIVKDGRLLVSGEIDELREKHKVMRLVYAEVPPEEEVSALRLLPDVMGVEREGRGVRLRVRGDVEDVRRSLRESEHGVRDVEVLGQNLEDIFVAYVEDSRDR